MFEDKYKHNINLEDATILALQGKLTEDVNDDIMNHINNAIQDFDDNNYNLRYKDVDTYIQDNTLIIEYQTQEDINNSDINKFVKEIIPSIEYIVTEFDNTLTDIKIHMFDRANNSFYRFYTISQDKNIDKKKTDSDTIYDSVSDVLSTLDNFDFNEFSKFTTLCRDYDTYINRLEEKDPNTNKFKVDWINDLYNKGLKDINKRKDFYRYLYMMRYNKDKWNELKNSLNK